MIRIHKGTVMRGYVLRTNILIAYNRTANDNMKRFIERGISYCLNKKFVNNYEYEILNGYLSYSKQICILNKNIHVSTYNPNDKANPYPFLLIWIDDK